MVTPQNLRLAFKAARALYGGYQLYRRHSGKAKVSKKRKRTPRRNPFGGKNIVSHSGIRSLTKIGPRKLKRLKATETSNEIVRQFSLRSDELGGLKGIQVLGAAWTGYDLAKAWNQLASHQTVNLGDENVVIEANLRMKPRTHTGKHMISNITNGVVYYRITDIVCKTKLIRSGTDPKGGQRIDPVAFFYNGLSAQDGFSSGNTQIWKQLSSTLSMSSQFNENFKIKRVRKGVLEPGASVQHTVVRTSKKLVKKSDIQESIGATADVSIPGLTGFSIIEHWGGPGIAIPDAEGTATVSLNPTSLAIVSSEKYTHAMSMRYPKFSEYENEVFTWNPQDDDGHIIADDGIVRAFDIAGGPQ